MNKNFISRRQFLISSSVGTSTLVFANSAFAVGKQVVDLLNPTNPLVMPPNFVPSIWFTMESNGRTTVHILRAEIGQHIGTAFAQIVAEELGLSWNNITIDYPEFDTNTFGKYGAQITGGSYSVHEMFDKLLRVSSVARDILLETGADLMGAEIEDCIAKNSTVIDTLLDQRITYSEILSETVIEHSVYDEDLETAKLKNRNEYTIIGSSVPAIDIPEKVNGSARFGIDAYVPNMVYAKIIPPPTRLGSKIKSIDDSPAKEIDGYLLTVPLIFPEKSLNRGEVTDVPVVIAKSFPAAMRAAQLVLVNWEVSETSMHSSESIQIESEAHLISGEGGSDYFRVGEFQAAKSSADKEISKTYYTSMVSHVPLEPMSALAHFVDDKLHVYSGHQAGAFLPMQISGFTGIDQENILFHPHLIGGGFGKKFNIEAVVFASLAAKHTGLPVKIIFTREDDMAFSHPRTPSVQKLTACIKGKDILDGFKHELAIMENGSILNVPPMQDGKPLLGEDVQKFNILTHAGSDNWYDIPNQTVKSYALKELAKVVPVGPVRSISNNYTIFALESFMDEIAYELSIDPLELRLSYLNGKGINSGPPKDQIEKSLFEPFISYSRFQKSSAFGGGKRLANVLRIASGIANYGTADLPKGTSHGIAVSAAEERQNPSFCACIAEVTVNNKSGSIKVNKITTVIDVGLVVNPDGVKAQVEGSVLWGLSATFSERMTVKEGSIVERNFDSYKWQNITNLPDLDIHIIGNGLYPSGAGEPAVATVSPAIVNAIFNASGVRLRSLPIDRKTFLDEIDNQLGV